jgi:hypothetical protein
MANIEKQNNRGVDIDNRGVDIDRDLAMAIEMSKRDVQGEYMSGSGQGLSFEQGQGQGSEQASSSRYNQEVSEQASSSRYNQEFDSSGKDKTRF